MSEITNTVLTGHSVSSGTSQGTGRAWTRNVFTAEDGREYQTFKAEIANQAFPLIGKSVSVVYEAKVRGDYTNYELLAVSETGQSQANPSQALSSAPVAAQTPLLTQPSVDARGEKISRAVGAKLALHAHAAGFEKLEGYQDFERVAAGFARFVETGSVRGE